jgi:putative membrane protein
MKIKLTRFLQVIAIVVVHAITLILLRAFLPGIEITSFLAAIGAAIGYTIAQAAFWLVFIEFLAWLPAILYPILTFLLSGFAVTVVANWLPGITIDNWVTGLWITIWMTVVNAVIGGYFAIDEDSIFDRVVTKRMVNKLGDVKHSDVPGFVFLEIDGLGEQLLRRAIQDGFMPNLKHWLDQGSHRITSWETDYSSQTGAMQTGILLGNNDEIPAYRWWDRLTQRIVMSGDPRDAIALEGKHSTGRGLLSDGGASRGNMFSGDASESLLTMSTVLNRKRGRGPGFYFYLFSPYILARLVTRFALECLMEWRDAWQQKRHKDPYRVSARNPAYALLRGFMSPFMQDLATYMVISDMLRGIPAIYALYAGYDDLSHFAGMQSPESFRSLTDIDRYFARIEKAFQAAPRPYHIIVLSDHGQTLGYTLKNAYGVNLEEVVDALIQGKGEVYAAQKTHETWDKLSALMSESIQDNSRTAEFLGKMIQSRREGDLVHVGPQTEDAKARASKVVTVASGGAGLIYFPDRTERLTQEQIQQAYPDLLLGLVQHPGTGFVLVRSSEQGDMAIGKKGIYYLKDDKIEGENPLIHYGPNAARHLKRESSFANCPDLLVNTVYNPDTQEMYCYENQASHHGSLGGSQNHPFVLHPISLVAGEEPIVTAEGLYRVMRGWRDRAQREILMTQEIDPG